MFHLAGSHLQVKQEVAVATERYVEASGHGRYSSRVTSDAGQAIPAVPTSNTLSTSSKRI